MFGDILKDITKEIVLAPVNVVKGVGEAIEEIVD